jgi:hypothetical protein
MREAERDGAWHYGTMENAYLHLQSRSTFIVDTHLYALHHITLHTRYISDTYRSHVNRTERKGSSGKSCIPTPGIG